MADHSRDRVEAAAKAITAAWSEKSPLGYARVALAAADDCDRVAGVVRVDTNAPGEAERLAMILHHYDWRAADGDPAALTRQLADECWASDEDLSHGEYRDRALYLLGALSVLGATGVGEQQGGQT